MDLDIRYLSGPDVKSLALTNDEILDAVEASLAAQGNGEAVIEPRMHLMPDPGFPGHFNVLRGYVGPLDVAGVKIVGDYLNNYKQGLPSEHAMLNLMNPRTGVPIAVLDATDITDMRTGAITALGARYLAPSKPRVLGHIGARGTAYWNVRLLDHLFDFEEIRIHSRRPESRDKFAERLRTDLGKDVRVTDNWSDCLKDADIMVEASRLEAPEPLLKTNWIKKGALIVPYGTMSAVEDNVLGPIDKVVVDHWPQCLIGPFGCLRRHVDSGEMTEDNIHGELGSIVAGHKPGRESQDETILFWHRGLSTSDIALGHAMLAKATERGVGHVLPYARDS
jgi:alanine dehydrogenase